MIYISMTITLEMFLSQNNAKFNYDHVFLLRVTYFVDF